MISIMIVIFMGLSSFTYSYYENDYSVISLIDFYEWEFLECTIPTAPLILYVVLLCNLKNRFAVLNNILRYELSSY